MRLCMFYTLCIQAVLKFTSTIIGLRLLEKKALFCVRVLEYEVEQVAYTNENIITTTLIISELTIKGYLGNLGCFSFFEK